MSYLYSGMSHTRLDNVYKSMQARCYNQSNKRYKNYGGRGIKICDEWLNDKRKFFEWAKGQGYDDTLPRGQMTLDRIDVDKDYSPENCRFISIEEQENNRTNNRYITLNGETKTIREWEKEKGMKSGRLWARLNRGWDIETAINADAGHICRR